MKKHTFTKRHMNLTGDALVAVLFIHNQDGSVHTEVKSEASIIHLGIAAEMVKNHFEQQLALMPAQESTNVRVAVGKALYPNNFTQVPPVTTTPLPYPVPMPTPTEGSTQR